MTEARISCQNEQTWYISTGILSYPTGSNIFEILKFNVNARIFYKLRPKSGQYDWKKQQQQRINNLSTQS